MEYPARGHTRHFVVLVLLAFFANLLFLDWWVMERVKENTQDPTQTEKVVPITDEENTDVCGEVCEAKIREATASLNISQRSQLQSAAQLPRSENEQFIPIGAGKSSAKEWEDVPGLLIIVNTANYNQIKSTQFEASVYVPSGNQWVDVRLYNITDNHPVWFSEFHFENAAKAASQRGNIVLDEGNKAYQVQMKTQLGLSTDLTASRIRIISQ